MEAVPGQAVAPQPALSDPTRVLNPHEAVEYMTSVIEEDIQKSEKPRDETGKFKAEVKSEEAKPEKEAAKEEPKAEEESKPEDEAEIQPEPRKFRLKYKGEEKEIDEPEAVELAQKGWDYTQKMQQLAKDREEVQTRVKTEQEAIRKQYEDQLEVQRRLVLKLADQEALNANLTQLAMEDPAKALQLQLRRQQIVETMQAVVGEQQKIAQQRQAEMQESYQKQAKEAVEKLQERIPGWNNDLYGKILKDAVANYGFDQKEVNAITDHRAIEVLNDALKWREYQSAKPKTVEKRVAAVPKVQKPGSAEKPGQSDKIKDGMDKLSKSGSRDDAVSLVQEMFRLGKL